MTSRLKRTSLLLAAAISVLSLSACDHFRPAGGTAKATKSTSGKSQVASAIASAAQDAADDGMSRESLMLQEKLYREDPRNPDYILNYARSLRRSGRIDDALLVIRTPAKGARTTEPLLTECAFVLIAAGKYDEALEFAQKALEKDDNSPNAHHALALAMSGLGKNADAQLQFEEALKLWPETRDKTSIINNLAMSLAAQGKITQARNMMSQATGEALRSATYQNNRALLDTLKDREIRAEKLVGAPENITVDSTPKTVSLAPVRPSVKKTVARMKPIIE